MSRAAGLRRGGAQALRGRHGHARLPDRLLRVRAGDRACLAGSWWHSATMRLLAQKEAALVGSGAYTNGIPTLGPSLNTKPGRAPTNAGDATKSCGGGRCHCRMPTQRTRMDQTQSLAWCPVAIVAAHRPYKSAYARREHTQLTLLLAHHNQGHGSRHSAPASAWQAAALGGLPTSPDARL